MSRWWDNDRVTIEFDLGLAAAVVAVVAILCAAFVVLTAVRIIVENT